MQTSTTRRRAWRPDQQWEAYLFLIPSLFGLLVFTAFPVFFSLYISFFEWDLIAPPVWIGAEHYRTLLTHDAIFRQVAWNTLYFLVGIVPVQTLLSLLLALLLNRKLPGMAFFRVLYYLPVITTIVAAALIFQWMFDRNYGVISALVRNLNEWTGLPLQPPDWLNSSAWAKPAVILLTLWKNVGFTTIIFLAALQGVPRELYEAAAMDGAGRWRSFFAVTLPLISATTFFVLIILIIGAFQLFGEAYIMTSGGPGYATMTIVQYIYQSAFTFFRMGKGAAISWVLFVAIFLLTLLQLRLQRRWVYYENGER